MGASFAGVEIASVLQRSGLDVVIVERQKRPSFRAWRIRRARLPWRGACSERGLDLRLGLVVSSVERRDDRLQMGLEGAAGAGAGPSGAGPAGDSAQAGRRDTAETFDLAVVCTGSRANLLLLEDSGLAANGGIDVDEAMTSSVPGLLAAGDVARLSIR